MLVDIPRWAEFIKLHPESHILQDGKWGLLKSSFGWKAERIICDNAGAQILFRSLPLGYSIAYIPKGPVELNDALLAEVDRVCKENKAVFIKVEPFAWEGDGRWIGLEEKGFVASDPIQPHRTVLIPLDRSEEDILAEMKQITRYNIRLAEKKGIRIRKSEDYQAFYKMALVTGERDRFGVHSMDYYLKVKELFDNGGESALFLAYYNEKPVAGIIGFTHGKNAWYMYGASTDDERNRMPTYLLQWEAIRWAKEKGCTEYDLWGIPDHAEDELEKLFTEREHHEGLWGVYRFKRGFGGKVIRSIGAWDKVYKPGLYKLYKTYNHFRKRGMD